LWYKLTLARLTLGWLKIKKMDITTKFKKNWKEDKENLHNEISSLKKYMLDYKLERKSEWRLFKIKFNEDMDKVAESLKNLTALHKNRSGSEST
jgi:hypothetical protein